MYNEDGEAYHVDVDIYKMKMVKQVVCPKKQEPSCLSTVKLYHVLRLKTGAFTSYALCSNCNWNENEEAIRKLHKDYTIDVVGDVVMSGDVVNIPELLS